MAIDKQKSEFKVGPFAIKCDRCDAVGPEAATAPEAAEAAIKAGFNVRLDRDRGVIVGPQFCAAHARKET